MPKITLWNPVPVCFIVRFVILNALFVHLVTMAKFTVVLIALDPHAKSPVMRLKKDINKLLKGSLTMHFANNAIENVKVK